jgi:chaperone BCS1
MDLAGMSDSMLQDAVKKFPRYCVILFEDIDAAGIVRESTMLKCDGKKQRNNEPIVDSDDNSEPVVTKALFHSRPRPAIVEPQPQPLRKTQVTLSGLLNTLDGLGSREGHIVILTMNAPDSLDKTIYRPGRIELKLFLGYSTSVTAGIKYIRIFGSEKRLMMSKGDLNRLDRRFGKMVFDNVLPPAEVHRFCMNRRGNPHKAIAELPTYLKEKRSGKPEFQYDINRAESETTVEEKVDTQDDTSDDGQGFTQNATESGRAYVIGHQTNQDVEGSTGRDTTSKSHNLIDGAATTSRYEMCEELHIAGSFDILDEDGLAYGEFHLWSDDEDPSRLMGGRIANVALDLLDTFASAFFKTPPDTDSIRSHNFSVPEMVMTSLSMRTFQTVSALTQTQPNTRGLGLDNFQAEIKGKAAPNLTHRYDHTSADSARRDLG